jgi:hypothetical protein
MWRCVGLIVLVALAELGAAPEALAFKGHYDCAMIGETWFAWEPDERRFKVGSHTERKRGFGSLVKLLDLNSESPKVAGQSVADLRLIGRDAFEMRFLEFTSGGTIVTWTLFKQTPTIGINKPILVSTKAYPFIGPATFTAVYECE